MTDVREIHAIAEDGSKTIYRGKGIAKFIRTFDDDDVAEIRVIYEEEVYRGKAMRKFVKEFSQTKDEQQEPKTVNGYHMTGITYKPISSDMSPQALARKMKEEAERTSGIKFD